jgi:hypothetical protein
MTSAPTTTRRSLRLQGVSPAPITSSQSNPPPNSSGPPMSSTALSYTSSASTARDPASKGKGRAPDGGDPDDEPGNGDEGDNNEEDDEEDPSVAGALHNLARSLRQLDRGSSGPPRSERVKAREPDKFDGNDPKKLKEWLFQCRLYFTSNPSRFPSDNAKITFAISYLGDTAMGWFQAVLENDSVEWSETPIMNDWDVFRQELQDRFGLLDASGEAAEELDALRMGYNQTIVKYDLEFMRLTAQLNWDDSVLCHRYYKGLPDRIQDAIAARPDGKPTSLTGMKNAANIADQRYWERQREKKRKEGPSHSHKSNDFSNKSNNDRGNKSTSSGSHPGKSHSSGGKSTTNRFASSSSGNHSSKPSGSNSNSSNKSFLDGKLGKNGKLTSQERQRRVDNNLCLFCGGSGHKVNECPRKNSSSEASGSAPAPGKAKGRKARAETKSPEN